MTGRGAEEQEAPGKKKSRQLVSLFLSSSGFLKLISLLVQTENMTVVCACPVSAGCFY